MVDSTRLRSRRVGYNNFHDNFKNTMTSCPPSVWVCVCHEFNIRLSQLPISYRDCSLWRKTVDGGANTMQTGAIWLEPTVSLSTYFLWTCISIPWSILQCKCNWIINVYCYYLIFINCD